MEAHGGYLCRYEDVDVAWLQGLARGALADDGQSCDDVGLQITLLNSRVVRFAWDAPFTYGRKGAHWYLTHHALARRLSEHLGVTVHAYVFDPDELEQVVAYGNGRRVGGDTLRYENAEPPEDDDDEAAFERLKRTWPMGHLARVLGVERDDLIRLPRKATLLIDVRGHVAAEPRPLWQLLPEALQVAPRPARAGERLAE